MGDSLFRQASSVKRQVSSVKRKFFRVGIVFFAVVPGAMYSFAGGAWVPSQTEAMPYYFTCTNARAKGEIVINNMPPGFSGLYTLNWGRMSIGNPGYEEVVEEWNYPVGGTEPVAGLSFSRMFDSTHFAPNSTIGVKVEATDTAGGYYVAEGYSPNRNEGVCFNHPDFVYVPGGNGAFTAKAMLNSMGYMSIEISGQWSDTTFGNACQKPILYESTHGDQFQILPGNQQNDVASNLIWALPNGDDVNVSSYRMLLNGTGLPPYNSTGLPPVNLFMMDSCNGGDAPYDFYSMSSPYTNYYRNPFPENQAVHGYTVFTMVVSSSLQIQTLLEFLDDGDVIADASYGLVQSGKKLGILIKTDAGVVTWLDDHDYVSIAGDWYTRINGVYTGNSTKAAAWFR